MPERKVFWGFNEQQPVATFSVEELEDEVEPGDTIASDVDHLKFEDDSSLGSMFFGMAIIHNILEQDHDVLLIINPADKGVDDKS